MQGRDVCKYEKEKIKKKCGGCFMFCIHGMPVWRMDCRYSPCRREEDRINA